MAKTIKVTHTVTRNNMSIMNVANTSQDLYAAEALISLLVDTSPDAVVHLQMSSDDDAIYFYNPKYQSESQLLTALEIAARALQVTTEDELQFLLWQRYEEFRANYQQP